MDCGAETLPRNEERSAASSYLPEAFADDPDRLARFQREAQVLASLNHPGIAAIYGLEDSGDTKALVLELVEGPTLADRIKRGPISLDEALPIAKQIAEALEAAHEADVIHRDLKPANIKVRDDGTVKVLDFGLAKALDPNPEGDPSQSPTLTAAATQMGVIMGTAAYMSPEQARGKVVDKRTDIWAFGCVLYEMLTGRHAFPGDDVSQTLARVIDRDPDWIALPRTLPAGLDRFLRRCLEKDGRQRVRDIGDVRLALGGAFDTEPAASSDGGVTSHGAGRRQAALWAAAALVLGALISGVGMRFLAPAAPLTQRVTRSFIKIPTSSDRVRSQDNRVALSPSGTHLAFAGFDQLYLRAMHQAEARAVPETAGPVAPFFSPDGQWVGFWSGGQLQKIAVSGGAPVTICDAGDPVSPSWEPDGTILFSTIDQGIWRVSADGGTPELIIPRGDSDDVFNRPQLLPGGEWVLFRRGREIVAQSLVSGDRTVLIENGGDAIYLPTGHLAYVREGVLLAVPFDVSQMAVEGAPVPLLEGVLQQSLSRVAQVAHSDDGMLVYQRSRELPSQRTLVWVDRQGNEEPLWAEPQVYSGPRLSPDGRRVAVAVTEGSSDIWIYDLEREVSTRLNSDPADDRFPLWTNDGERVVFMSDRDGGLDLFSTRADGTGAIEPLPKSMRSHTPYSFTPDGQLVVFAGTSGDATNTGIDIGILSPSGEREPEVLLASEFDESQPRISPNGRWIAYTSAEAGEPEVYVRPFPNVHDGRTRISPGYGVGPTWGRDGQELFYQTRVGSNTALVAVAVDTSGSTFEVKESVTLFDGPYRLGTGPSVNAFDVSPDGERFLMIRESGASDDRSGDSELIVVHNWFEELKRLVPVD